MSIVAWEWDGEVGAVRAAARANEPFRKVGEDEKEEEGEKEKEEKGEEDKEEYGEKKKEEGRESLSKLSRC